MTLRRWAALALILAGLLALGEAGWIRAKAELAQVLLDRAWTRARSGDESPRPWPWADTWPVARLVAPAHDVDTIVLSGASLRNLAFAPSHFDGTPLPGRPGNAVIAGHRDTHFRFLENLLPGDELLIETANAGAPAVPSSGSDDHRARRPHGARAGIRPRLRAHPDHLLPVRGRHAGRASLRRARRPRRSRLTLLTRHTLDPARLWSGARDLDWPELTLLAIAGACPYGFSIGYWTSPELAVLHGDQVPVRPSAHAGADLSVRLDRSPAVRPSPVAGGGRTVDHRATRGGRPHPGVPGAAGPPLHPQHRAAVSGGALDPPLPLPGAHPGGRPWPRCSAPASSGEVSRRPTRRWEPELGPTASGSPSTRSSPARSPGCCGPSWAASTSRSSFCAPTRSTGNVYEFIFTVILPYLLGGET